MLDGRTDEALDTLAEDFRAESRSISTGMNTTRLVDSFC
jgi:hypothetical protein